MTERWYCRRCGIVRDLPAGTGAPFCRHGDPAIVATRMSPIPSWHPYATGPLPWRPDEAA